MIKISFMTFVCPTWEIGKIAKFAKQANYDGVEIRVDAGHKHDVSSQTPADRRKYVKKLFDDEGVKVPCVATSIQFGSADLAKRKENIASAKANLDLAADLGANIVRMFAGGGISSLNKEAAEYIAEAFDEVGDYAKASGVCPMLECGHDIIVTAKEADEVFKRIKTTNFCALWNYSEMDDQTFNIMKPRLRHFHVHEEVLEPKNDNILRLSKLMKTIGYDGYYSLEIIRGEDLPEDLLIETAKRLKGYIMQA